LEIEPDKWTGSIADLPDAAQDKDHSYFAAWGEFESPARLPGTYLKPAPRGLTDGKLLVEYEQEEHVLVVDYRWRETLTDIVTLEDMRRSRRQFLEIVLPLVERCLETALGSQYEVDGLAEWFRTTGSEWFVELTDSFFEAGTRGQLPPSDAWKQTMADVCGRYGLNLRDAGGQLLDEERARDAVAQFASEILQQKLKRRDGAAVPQQVIDDLLEWVNLRDHSQADGPRLARLDGLAQRVIAEQYGSQQNFEALMTPLAARMLGLYRVEILGPPRRFDYTLQMPGLVVETNGVLVADDRVRWKFEAVEAYPFGYPMECRAVAPRRDVQRKLLGAEPLVERQDMLAYVAAVSSDFALAEAMRNCARRESIEPLLAARERVASESGDTRPFDVVLQLLKLSPTRAAE
jgi:hypothetical protein